MLWRAPIVVINSWLRARRTREENPDTPEVSATLRECFDTYVGTTAVDVEDPEPKTLDDPDVDVVAASATLSEHRLTRAELLLANKKPWIIPKLVPRGYNVPIAIHSSLHHSRPRGGV